MSPSRESLPDISLEGVLIIGAGWVIYAVGGAVLGMLLGADSPGWRVIDPAFLGWVGAFVPLQFRR